MKWHVLSGLIAVVVIVGTALFFEHVLDRDFIGPWRTLFVFVVAFAAARFTPWPKRPGKKPEFDENK